MPVLETLNIVSRTSVGKVLALAVKRGAMGGQQPLALDCTAGNGNDTLFLAQAVGPMGKVMAFDVQQAAIAATSARLAQAGLSDRVSLVNAGHATLARVLPEAQNTVDAALFNLGFLPGGRESLVTRPETTLAALDALLPRIKPGGLYSVHCYTGHAGGMEEAQGVALWFQDLPWRSWRVSRQEFANKLKNREILFLAERLV